MLTHLLQSMAEDIRFAFRMMRHSLGLTAVDVLSLGLGIGATIAIFSVTYALALRPLSVERPDQLVEVARADEVNLHSYAEWKLFRDRQDIFSDVLAYNDFDTDFHIGPATQQQEVSGLYVSGNYFRGLGVPAVLGRVLQPSDDQPGAPPVCVLSYSLWRRLYGQAKNILAQNILVNGNEFRIVGVAPRSFFGVFIGAMPEIFMPFEAERTYRDYQMKYYGWQTPSLDDPTGTILCFVGRLKPGASVSQANAGLQVLGPEISRMMPPRWDQNGRPIVPRPLIAQPMSNAAGTSGTWAGNIDVMLLLIAMAIVALVIACANVGNLLLARAAKRRSEIATRLTLGASRWRLVRQLLTESIALSVSGAAAGLFIAHWGRQLLLWTLSYPGEPIMLDVSWDPKLVVFSLGITLSCSLLFGLAPALGATDISLYSAMNNGATTGRPKKRSMNSGLVVVQVALSVALIFGAGLLARTLYALLAQDPGYDPRGVIGAQAKLQGPGESLQRAEFIGDQLLREFRSVPGVTSASWSRNYPARRTLPLSVPGPKGSERQLGSFPIFVSSDFFRTRRTPVLAGREFSDSDTEQSFPVAVLSKELAKRLFGGVNPVGLRFREKDGDDNGQGYAVEVVGVSKDIQYGRPGHAPFPILYRPVSQCAGLCSGIGGYEIRAAGSLAEMTKRLEAETATIDPRIVLKCHPQTDDISNSVHRNRATAWMATIFGLFAGLLALIGVYGVTSYATAERTREIGIRMALGAQPGGVFRMVMRETMTMVFIGIALGVGAGLASASLIRGIIWGVKPTDPLSLGAAICLMLLIAGTAAFFPARRALSVDPMVALRYE
ncbi:MAG TPA: ABC transporter permease [Candidatus Acidoferrum sp.]|nr:ABC transporter permease [Candidatus Acidoferrum sp.]